VRLSAQIAAVGAGIRPQTAVGTALSRNFAIHYRFAFALADSFSYYLLFSGEVDLLRHGDGRELDSGGTVVLGVGA
jgi:hypothetical protein